MGRLLRREIRRKKRVMKRERRVWNYREKNKSKITVE